MSADRRRRLTRTLIVGGVVFLLAIAALIRAFGDDADATRTSSSAEADGRAAGAAAPATGGPGDAGPGTASAPGSAAQPVGDASATGGRDDPTVVPSGDGEITVLAAPGQDTARDGRTVTFSVEAEGGLGIDLDDFAASVRTILSDDRGWEGMDSVHFVALTPEKVAQGATPAVRITLASPELTDRLCAPLNTNGEVSCNQGGRAVINAKRWLLGVPHYEDLSAYRTYLINHEVGHGLGHGHVSCPGAGERAPVMLQQTHGLQGCVAWPYPAGD